MKILMSFFQWLLLLCVLPVSLSVWAADTRFNPKMSVILGGAFYSDNHRGEAGENIQGYNSAWAGDAHGDHEGGHEGEHHHAGLDRYLNLQETEVVMSATADPWFDGYVNLSIDDSGNLEVEEAWAATRMLPAGFRLKVGKFFSSVGYHNEKHPHSWLFVDQHLVYQQLLGEHGLNDKGIQLSWLAPTEQYVWFGLEALRGEEQEQVGTALDEATLAEVAALTEDGSLLNVRALDTAKSSPDLVTAFAKWSRDTGARSVIQLGVSLIRQNRLQQFHHDDENDCDVGGADVGINCDSFLAAGTARIAGVDGVWKYRGKGPYGAGDWLLAGEYFQGRKDLSIKSHDSDLLALGLPIKARYSGYYIAARYGLRPRLSLSLHYDAGGKTNEQEEAGITTTFGDSRRISSALTWRPSEFSFLRLQFSHVRLNRQYDKWGSEMANADIYRNQSHNQVMLQYNHSLGAHGAHGF